MPLLLASALVLTPTVTLSATIGERLGRQHPAAGEPTAVNAATKAEQGGIDVNGVIDQVSHHVAASTTEPGTLVASDRRYVASFDGKGVGVGLPGEGELAVSLRSVSRDGTALTAAPRAWRASANVASREVGPGLTERVTARSGEVEWDVVLAARPPGHGDLRLTADLGGLAPSSGARPSSRSLELAGGGAVRLGDAVVVDAEGRELARSSPSVEGSALGIDVPAEVLAEAAYPLTIDPTVSPENAITPPSGMAGGQLEPAVATNGTDFFVVWRDDKLGQTREDRNQVVGTRVKADGTVLDPSGIFLSGSCPSLSRCSARTPAVAFGNGAYTVVWQSNAGIVGLRVTAAGAKLDDAPFPIGLGVQGPVSNPAVTFNGTTFLVVWEEDQGGGVGTDVMGARVTGNTVMDDPRLGLVGGFEDQTSPALASDGSGFLLTWVDQGVGQPPDVNARRMDGSLNFLDAAALPIGTGSGEQRSPAVAFGGATYLVTWQDDRAGTDDIRAARVTPAGALPDPVPLTLSTAGNDQVFPAVTFDGTNFVVVWRDGRSGAGWGVFGTRVSPAAAVLDPSGIAISTAPADPGAPALAARSGTALVVWDDHRLLPPGQTTGFADIWGTRLNSTGAVLDPQGRLISLDATFFGPRTIRPDVAFNGTEFLITWFEDRSGDTEIYATRVLPDGTVLDPNGILVLRSPGSPQQFTDLAVATDGNDFLIAALRERFGQLSVSKVTADGVVGAAQFPAATVISDVVSLAYNGTRYLLVQTDITGSVSGRFVSPSGVSGPSFQIDPGTGDRAKAPVVAAAGGRFLVFWTGMDTFQTHAALVDDAGTVTGVAGLPSPSTSRMPAVASNGSDFLLTWSASSGIVAARVNGNGSVLDSVAIPVAPTGTNPSVAFNGSWLIAYQETRGIYGVRVRTNGTVADNPAFPIAAGVQAQPYLAKSSSDDWLVVYSRLDPTVNSSRLFTRTVSPK